MYSVKTWIQEIVYASQKWHPFETSFQIIRKKQRPLLCCCSRSVDLDNASPSQLRWGEAVKDKNGEGSEVPAKMGETNKLRTQYTSKVRGRKPAFLIIVETYARFNHECPRTPGYKTHGSDKRGSFSLLITFQISQTSCFRRFLKSWVELSQLGSRFAVATSPAVVSLGWRIHQTFSSFLSTVTAPGTVV